MSAAGCDLPTQDSGITGPESSFPSHCSQSTLTAHIIKKNSSHQYSIRILYVCDIYDSSPILWQRQLRC